MTMTLKIEYKDGDAETAKVEYHEFLELWKTTIFKGKEVRAILPVSSDSNRLPDRIIFDRG